MDNNKPRETHPESSWKCPQELPECKICSLVFQKFLEWRVGGMVVVTHHTQSNLLIPILTIILKDPNIKHTHGYLISHIRREWWIIEKIKYPMYTCSPSMPTGIRHVANTALWIEEGMAEQHTSSQARLLTIYRTLTLLYVIMFI